MALFDDEIPAKIETSRSEIPHPSLSKGSNIYGSTKIFPDYQAEGGESYFTLVHGIAHESSVSFVASLDEEPRRQLLDAVGAILQRHGLGTDGQPFAFPMRTHVVCFRRAGR